MGFSYKSKKQEKEEKQRGKIFQEVNYCCKIKRLRPLHSSAQMLDVRHLKNFHVFMEMESGLMFFRKTQL